MFDRFSLDDALQDALIHNKEEFVHLFLEIGANLKTFLNEHRLHELYKQVPYLNKQHDLGGSSQHLKGVSQCCLFHYST